jgi:diaminohydroxyphosphoribosylaminopyrimidine deaminase/5-amino-6-(5-phosphoribosylamino)uracil reductase
MDYMQRALGLARRALGDTSPNPAVGAVIVRQGRVVGEGWTQPPGGHHAEIKALAMAGEEARGATLYVTLEPCSHYGRTPPCSQALLRAGIAEVHAAIQDPYPQVNGSGIRELEAAGVRVVLGEREEEARQVMEAYLKWTSTGLPFVIAKYAMSLDGKIATATGESRWITGPEARRRVHELRGDTDAIMVGIGTALADDPQLTARDEADRALERQPLRVVIDSGARLPPAAAMLRAPGKTLVATADPPDARVRPLVDAGAEVLRLPDADGRVDLSRLLCLLGERPVTSLLAEGGGVLLASLVRLGLVDRIMAFIAPIIIGGREAPTPVEGSGAPDLAGALRLHNLRVERLGDDLLVTGNPVQAR